MCEKNVFDDKRVEAATTGSVSLFSECSVSGERGYFESVFEFVLLNGGDVYVVSVKVLF